MNVDIEVKDTTKTNDELMEDLSNVIGQDIHYKPSYSIVLDGEITEDDTEDYANDILSSLDTNIDTTNMVVTTDTVNNVLTMTSPNGDKVVVSTEDGKTKVVIYSDIITEEESYDAVNDATQTKDTTLKASAPVTTPANVSFNTIVEETSQITVPLISDIETAANNIAINLGFTDTTSFMTTFDSENNTVSLNILLDDGITVVNIKISELNKNSVIQISPISISNVNYPNYDIITSVNTTLSSSYDSNDITNLEPGSYIQINTDYDDKDNAENAK